MAEKKIQDEHLSSNHNSVSKPSPDPLSSPTNVTQCPHCHEHITQIKMVKHLEHCHSWTSSYKSPDGSIKTTSYADSNQASLSLPNDADQIFKSCPYCGSTFQRDMTAHVERCPQRPSVTALQSFERSIYQPRTIRNNNTVSNRFSAIAISCPRCGDLRHLENKMRHAKQCQKVDITFQTANGTSGSIFYAGPNDRLVKGLRQAATDECSNRLDQQ